MRWIGGLMVAVLMALAALPAAAAEVRVDALASSLTAGGRERDGARPLTLALALDRAVPFRTLILDAPPRLVIDLDGADFGGADPAALTGAGLVPALRWGPIAPGRARLVAELPGPMRLGSAMVTRAAKGVVLTARLEPVAPEEFAPDGTGAALPQLWDLPQPAPLPPAARRAPGPLRVTLDPGHGGFDPGARADGLEEAALMLIMAEEVAAELSGYGVEVTLTRVDDRFLPLERRMTVARSAGSDLLISLHADALPEGEAAGAAVYVWNPDADDRGTQELATRHDRDDLLAGIDLASADDEIARTLMDIARLDTQPRSQNMAAFLVSEFALGRIAIHKRPVKGAAFSVLKSPDIPSVLIETGFLTDPADRANLADPLWRARMAGAIAKAVVAWAEDDDARTPLLRR